MSESVFCSFSLLCASRKKVHGKTSCFGVAFNSLSQPYYSPHSPQQIDSLRAAVREGEEGERQQSVELRRLREELASVQGRYACVMSVLIVFFPLYILAFLGDP